MVPRLLLPQADEIDSGLIDDEDVEVIRLM